MRYTEFVSEDLRKWFKQKWVRFGPDGKIRGDCARGSSKEGKPKCLPQAKAQALGKKGRASAGARKRRKDPNPERTGKAINVNTKKKNENYEIGVAEAGRVARKSGQPANSKKHSDLYTDENPRGTITGLKFATPEDARASVTKIRNSGRSHAHKIQAAVAMEQRAKAAGKAAAAAVYRRYINATKKTDEDINLDEACWDGYQQQGMKNKGGRQVPNCVPVSEQEIAEGPAAVKALRKDLLNPTSYDAIDHMMQTIAKKHSITPKQLHDRFVKQHGNTPDDWIKSQGITEQQLDEKCWKGYHKEGNKKMFGKTYPNCVKNKK